MATIPTRQGECRLQYNAQLNVWEAQGFLGSTWRCLGMQPYGVLRGSKFDNWYSTITNDWIGKIATHGQHWKTAAQAYSDPTSQSFTIPSGAPGFATTTGTFTVTGVSSHHPSAASIANAGTGDLGSFGGGGGLGNYVGQQLNLQNALQNQLNQTQQAVQSQLQLQTWQTAFQQSEVPVTIKPGETKFGEIVAWRAWRHGPHGLLQSMAMETIWIPGEPMEGDPTTGNCGVYAWKTREDAITYANPPYRIIGEIYLYGTVDEYEVGYRAQYATIKSLEVVDDLEGRLMAKPDVEEMIAKLRKRYLPKPPAVAND